eukprot:4616105-Prymnesium_polylepis.1
MSAPHTRPTASTAGACGARSPCGLGEEQGAPQRAEHKVCVVVTHVTQVATTISVTRSRAFRFDRV